MLGASLTLNLISTQDDSLSVSSTSPSLLLLFDCLHVFFWLSKTWFDSSRLGWIIVVSQLLAGSVSEPKNKSVIILIFFESQSELDERH